MTQPKEIPVIASGGGNYSAPGKPWDGTAKIVALSDGAVAAGFSPEATFDAQSANWLFKALGQHVKTLSSIAVDNWSDERRTIGSGVPYRTHAQFGRVFGATSGTLAFSLTSAGGGPFAYSSASELDTWTAAGVSGLGGFTNWSPCFSDGSTVITCRESTGGVFQTSNLGGTWTDAGTGVSLSTWRMGMYSSVASLWIIVGAGGGDNAIYVDGNLSGAWTYVAPAAAVLADTNVQRDMKESPSEILIAYSNGYISRSTNGTTWAEALLPNYSGDIVGLAWSESHSLWACLGTTGKVWFSATGASGTWAEGTTMAGTYTAGGRLAALGRYWVAGSATPAGILRFDASESVLVPEYFGSISGPSDLYYHAGSKRVVAAISAAGDLYYKLSLRVLG